MVDKMLLEAEERMKKAIEAVRRELSGIRTGKASPALLDTIREYALERLDESPEAEEVRRRHAEFYLAVAECANLNAGKRGLGKQTQMHHDIAIREADNVRGALAWTLATGAHALGLAIATSVEQFWIMHDPPEGVRWFARLLGRPAAECVAPEIRADALRAYGGWRVTSTPASSTVPASGRSNPAISRSSVVLPEPEGPSIVKNSPSATSRSTPATAASCP